MDILLKGVFWHDGQQPVSGDVRIEKGMIRSIGTQLQARKGEPVVDGCDCYLYPGLINAHDHLEMNLYSHLGKPPYRNYIEWASSIYNPDTSPIREIERVNIRDRLLWGGLKNLVSGVTTVVHHNPWHRMLGRKDYPVKVLKIRWAHSLKLGGGIGKSSGRGSKLVIHAAEGIDDQAYGEISMLDKLGSLRNAVLIHAIGLSSADVDLIAKEHSSVVWCPASNLYMFNRTAPVDELKSRIPVALGSDSTLTGSATLLDEMKAARATRLATALEIFNMVTRVPARIFNLPLPELAPEVTQDFFLARKKSDDYFGNLIDTSPGEIELVVTGGRLKLIDQERAGNWKPLKNLINVQRVAKYLDIDASSLKDRIVKIAGIANLESNPLWRLIDA